MDISRRHGEPDANQVAAYKTFQDDTPTFVRLAEAAVAEYFRSTAGVTEAAAQRGVAEAVKLEAISFPYARPRPTFGFLCKCNWDEEHGLAVKFEDGQITDVGPQDILL